METPLLSRGISLDCHIDAFATEYYPGGHSGLGGREAFYLQTSPEFHMKRLLCRGFPDIYQITRSFRNGESGRWHNPEFTMLEWYRKDFSLEDLMTDAAGAARCVLGDIPAEFHEYADLFRRETRLDPLQARLEDLTALSRERGGEIALAERADALNHAFARYVEPSLPTGRLVFVHRYPQELACLAVLDGDGLTARRFELYYNGVELCNGYQELSDPGEYRRRFRSENLRRQGCGKPMLPTDPNFLLEMESGLPPCSGAALGLDRLIALGKGLESLAEALTFPWGRA